MKIASWNVNSIRARHDLVLDWLRREDPTVLCMQETKVVDDDFPTEEFQRLGYAVAMAGQRTYNGVAIASRRPMKDIAIGLEGDGRRSDKRLIAATIDGVRVYSAYVPNGKTVDHPSFPEKLAWLGRLKETLSDDPLLDQVALCGDFNVARDERDVYDPEAFAGKVHFHPDEHAALASLMDLGLGDALRMTSDAGAQYTWWDYRGGGYRKNEGLRIDYVFLGSELQGSLTGVRHDQEEREREKPSDHIPVIVELAVGHA